MKIINKFIIAFAGIFLISSCQFFDYEKQYDPFSVTPANAGVDYLYNNIQLDFNNFYYAAHEFGAPVSRMLAMTAGKHYESSYTALGFNGIWGVAYNGMLPDMEAMIAKAAESNLEFHIANVKIMKSYMLTTLVDLFGDVPYTEATQGTDFISPKVDQQDAIYATALTLLDEAVTTLKATTAAAPNIDMFYGGDKDNWIAFANTLKLRIYNNTRLVDATAGTKIQQIIANENIIDDPSEDFQFNYGNNRNNPDNRHPGYADSYETTDGTYQSNYYMWLMLQEGNKYGMDDPRARFYFFRQDTDLSDEDPTTWGCYLTSVPVDGPTDTPPHYSAVDPDMCYCVGRFDGYYGRDHGNDTGIPPDGPIRTVYGVYPAGGLFDDGKGGDVQKSGTLGGLGKGINPIMLSSYVYFMRAEAALTAGTSDDAKAMLMTGIEHSMDKVFSFENLVDVNKVIGQDVGGNDITIKSAFIDGLGTDMADYMAEVSLAYDAADATGKLDIVMTEYFKALYGNGLESYNNLRRTSMPSNVQPMLEANPGTFLWSALYPTNFVDRNQFATQKSMADKIFWDTSSATAVK